MLQLSTRDMDIKLDAELSLVHAKKKCLERKVRKSPNENIFKHTSRGSHEACEVTQNLR